MILSPNRHTFYQRMADDLGERLVYVRTTGRPKLWALLVGLLQARKAMAIRAFYVWPCGVIAWLSGKPYCIHEWLGPPGQMFVGWKGWLCRQAVRNAGALYSPSVGHAQDLERLTGRPWRVWPNSITLEPEPELRILAFGRDSYEKGFDLLVEATRGLPVMVLAVGWQSSAPQVRALPWVGRDVVHDLIRRWADVVVVPSRYESYGLSAAEAARLGADVIATRVGMHGGPGVTLVEPNAHDIRREIEKRIA